MFSSFSFSVIQFILSSIAQLQKCTVTLFLFQFGLACTLWVFRVCEEPQFHLPSSFVTTGRSSNLTLCICYISIVSYSSKFISTEGAQRLRVFVDNFVNTSTTSVPITPKETWPICRSFDVLFFQITFLFVLQNRIKAQKGCQPLYIIFSSIL